MVGQWYFSMKIITFRVRHSWGKMCIGHGRLYVCLSLATFPHYCVDPDVSWGNGRGCPLVVHYWVDLQSVHRFRCYDDIAPNANCQWVLVLVLCLVFTVRRNARIASAVLATAVPSVCLSHAGIVSKRRHVARYSLHCLIAKCVYFCRNQKVFPRDDPFPLKIWLEVTYPLLKAASFDTFCLVAPQP